MAMVEAAAVVGAGVGCDLGWRVERALTTPDPRPPTALHSLTRIRALAVRPQPGGLVLAWRRKVTPTTEAEKREELVGFAAASREIMKQPAVELRMRCREGGC